MPQGDSLESLLFQAPTLSTLTSAYQIQNASGPAYVAVRSTQAPFSDVALQGQNPTLLNSQNFYGTIQDNFLFTPVTQMPTAQVLAQMVPTSGLESPAEGQVDASVLDNTVAGLVQSVAIPRSATFTGEQSVLNVGGNSLNTIPASLGLAMTNLSMTTSLMPTLRTPTLRYIPYGSGNVSFNLRSSGLQAFSSAKQRAHALNNNGVIESVM